MDKKTEALKLALDYLLSKQVGAHIIATLREALAEQPVQQEPVTHCEAGPEYCPVCHKEFNPEPAIYPDEAFEMGLEEVAFYTSPPPQRKPLTDEEIDRVTDTQWARNNHKPIYVAHRAFARAIEAKLQEKNT